MSEASDLVPDVDPTMLTAMLPILRRPQDSDPASVSYRSRKRRFAWIEQMLNEIINERGFARVLDVGGRAQYWRLLEPALYSRVHVTVLNLPNEPQTSINAPPSLDIDFQVGNACEMPEIADGSYDLCHSNSVIEHVGSLSNMALFAKETKRVASAFYHQTPSLWFPIEPHYGVPFFHWLPKPIRATLLARRKIGYGGRAANFHAALEIADHTEIITPALMRQLFPDAELLRERYDLFCKSIAVRGRS